MAISWFPCLEANVIAARAIIWTFSFLMSLHAYLRLGGLLTFGFQVPLDYGNRVKLDLLRLTLVSAYREHVARKLIGIQVDVFRCRQPHLSAWYLIVARAL